ncbi:hypothetical protein Holit_02833 [Hollandina sp. SP2]
MRIGVITLWGCGYGQNIQAYALQKFLRDMGHDAYLIRYPSINYNGNGENHKILKMFLPPVMVYLLRYGKKHNLARDVTPPPPPPPEKRN